MCTNAHADSRSLTHARTLTGQCLLHGKNMHLLGMLGKTNAAFYSNPAEKHTNKLQERDAACTDH